VVGWSTGGGHGPYRRSQGLGVDNALEVELVTGNGTIVVAKATTNADLFWAIRGGGGSVWGVVTAITVRAHAVPAGGITTVNLRFQGDMSDSGVGQMREVTRAYANWAVGLDARWSGTGGALDESCFPTCGKVTQWTFFADYLFLGGADEINIQDAIEQLVPANFTSFTHSVTPYEDVWSFTEATVASAPLPNHNSAPGYIPAPLLNARSYFWNAMESSFIDKATTKDRFPEHVVSTYLEKGSVFSFSHDIPDGSTEPANATSISQAFREAALLLEYPGCESLSLDTYFSESPYEMPGTSWQERYWGEGRYQKLLSIKNKFDPQGILWCHHCVGSEDEDVEAADRRRLGDFLA